MHSPLALDGAVARGREFVVAFLCGFGGAIVGAVISLTLGGDNVWVAGSIIGAASAAWIGWRNYNYLTLK